MVLVSPTQVNPGDEITADSVNIPNNQLANAINGNIDDDNISTISGTKISTGTIPGSAMTDEASPYNRTSETVGNLVVSGLSWTVVSGLNAAMSSGIAYVSGKRVEPVAIASQAFTASRDTYVYVDNTGTIQYDAQTNGAAMPSTPADYMLIALVVTGGASISRIANFAPGVPDIWEEIGRTRLAVAGDTISVQNLPNKRYLKVEISVEDTGGSIICNMRFNNDTGNNYATRRSANGAADATSTGDSSINVGRAVSATPQFVLAYIENRASIEKMVQCFGAARGTAGAGNAPDRNDTLGKWANTSATINRIDVVNSTGSGDYAIGSQVTVYGHN